MCESTGKDVKSHLNWSSCSAWTLTTEHKHAVVLCLKLVQVLPSARLQTARRANWYSLWSLGDVFKSAYMTCLNPVGFRCLNQWFTNCDYHTSAAALGNSVCVHYCVQLKSERGSSWENAGVLWPELFGNLWSKSLKCSLKIVCSVFLGEHFLLFSWSKGDEDNCWCC